jgi:hypothetical protein
LATKRRARAALWATAISVALLIAGINTRLLTLLDAHLSPRTAARAALEKAPRGEGLATFELPRAWSYGLNFYAGREIPEWTPQMRPMWLITSDAGRIELWRLGVRPIHAQRVSRQATILYIE